MKTQKQWVLEQLLRGRKITALSAYTQYGVLRLSSIIHVLRKREGYPIITTEIAVKNRRQETCYIGEHHMAKAMLD